MTRTISVSTDVFAAIWACRQDGEETEEAILRRLLGRAKASSSLVDVQSDDAPAAGGVHDTRNNVHFPEGFEVFRTYKRQEFKARAQAGAWVREDTGERFPTLNQLNDTITAGPENIWNGNWKYRAANGKLRSINDLRS
ncbi:MAG: hypothetical protein EOQ92_22990 [Mesorhizobium sp.]|uniref:hypothetical protein n=1 Tax=Mesorhizobium sp. TaxID=1871066 RepID=UPI000FE47383|nr:hypothetical protein [Mesorhizobium sp.]RWI18634.1 MAG: hypothetical protein EOQ92_22990 [Mesorhizobium sp.]RWK93388.1 MAG: hypothetical protein EOR53_23565 [Mesorhizobium sp.]TJW39333.1 MAG: hypothetical protein E5X59_29735 [Mesorhizobium sp.]